MVGTCGPEGAGWEATEEGGSGGMRGEESRKGGGQGGAVTEALSLCGGDVSRARPHELSQLSAAPLQGGRAAGALSH